MARLGFEARITVRALHPNRFGMCSPAPSKRVFHEPLEAEDNQPDAERRDGCCAKCEGDHHADHMNLPAYSWRTLPHRAGAWSSNFKLTHYPSSGEVARALRVPPCIRRSRRKRYRRGLQSQRHTQIGMISTKTKLICRPSRRR